MPRTLPKLVDLEKTSSQLKRMNCFSQSAGSPLAGSAGSGGSNADANSYYQKSYKIQRRRIFQTVNCGLAENVCFAVANPPQRCTLLPARPPLPDTPCLPPPPPPPMPHYLQRKRKTENVLKVEEYKLFLTRARNEQINWKMYPKFEMDDEGRNTLKNM